MTWLVSWMGMSWMNRWSGLSVDKVREEVFLDRLLIHGHRKNGGGGGGFY